MIDNAGIVVVSPALLLVLIVQMRERETYE